MSNKVTPMLWFEGDAEEAMNFYVGLFKDSEIHNVSRMGEGAPVITCSFTVVGQTFTGLNAGPMFKFTEAVSFVIDCEDQAEVDYYWNGFISNGGEEGQCGWLKDKWGLSWQVTPRRLIELITDPDPVKANAVQQAMFQMRKIEIDKLEAAYAAV